MGIYVNPGNTAFEESIHSPIYVDKTELIRYTNAAMNTYNKFICVSRPRRFGKTMAADMLTAYYSKGCDSRELFAGRKIVSDSSFERHLNRYQVIRIDVQQFLKSGQEQNALIERIQKAVLRELRREFPGNPDLAKEDDLQMALNAAFLANGEKFIFILDEWDCVFRAAQDQEQLQKRYLDFLRDIFKGAIYVNLVYMTGILPIKKYGEHSAVNMFREYSMIHSDQLSTYFGFTSEEVHAECSKHDVNFNEMKQWYDGYLLDGNHIYNPRSVTGALDSREIRSYWTGTETYDALKVYIERNFDGMREAVIEMIAGGRCEVDTSSFQNDMTTFRSRDDILTLMIHLGYLTYDKNSRCVSIPNLEVQQEFIRAIKNGAGWGGLMKSLDRSYQLLEDTWRMDGDAVASAIEKIHSETTSLFTFHNENSLACVIYIAYYSARAYYMNPIAELPTGKGRADIVYLPRKDVDRPALLVELKWDKSAESAIQQIKERGYTQWVENYTGDILLVGINYDDKTKKHSCIIERFEETVR